MTQRERVLEEALQNVVYERETELDKMRCPFAHETPENNAWHEGVYAVWARLKIVKDAAKAALAAPADAPLTGKKDCCLACGGTGKAAPVDAYVSEAAATVALDGDTKRCCNNPNCRQDYQHKRECNVPASKPPVKCPRCGSEDAGYDLHNEPTTLKCMDCGYRGEPPAQDAERAKAVFIPYKIDDEFRPSRLDEFGLRKNIAIVIQQARIAAVNETKRDLWAYVKTFIQTETGQWFPDDGSTFEDWFHASQQKAANEALEEAKQIANKEAEKWKDQRAVLAARSIQFAIEALKGKP